MKFRDYIEKNAILKMSGLTPDGDTVDIIKVGYYAVSEEEFKKRITDTKVGWNLISTSLIMMKIIT